MPLTKWIIELWARVHPQLINETKNNKVVQLEILNVKGYDGGGWWKVVCILTDIMMDEVVLTWLESNCFLNPKPWVGNMV